MAQLKTSVLIPSFRRPSALAKCLASLAKQTKLPDEVIVVWQADDMPTAQAVSALQSGLPFTLILLHNTEKGVVPAENAALDRATGEIILLLDDDAVAPATWVERHVAQYADATVGAVGGPADCFFEDLTRFPLRANLPIGKLTWYGKSIGNMYDQLPAWRTRSPVEVDHLVGYNMSLRRSAFARFQTALKPYWQMFETDACLQVKDRGLKVLFDFANVVEHYPTNTAFVPGRAGDLVIKVFNPAYNHSFVMAFYSPWYLRPFRLMYLLLVGSTGAPAFVSLPIAIKRYGGPVREIKIALNCMKQRLSGWSDGAKARRSALRAPRP